LTSRGSFRTILSVFQKALNLLASSDFNICKNSLRIGLCDEVVLSAAKETP